MESQSSIVEVEPLVLEPNPNSGFQDPFFIAAGTGARSDGEESDSDDGAEMELVPTMAMPKKRMGSVFSQISGCSGLLEEPDSPSLGAYRENPENEQDGFPKYLSRQGSLAESCGSGIALGSATTDTGLESSMSPSSIPDIRTMYNSSMNVGALGNNSNSNINLNNSSLTPNASASSHLQDLVPSHAAAPSLLSASQDPANLSISGSWSQSQLLAETLREERSGASNVGGRNGNGNGGDRQPKAPPRTQGRLRNSFGTILPGTVGQGEEDVEECTSQSSGPSVGFRNSSSAHVNVVMSLRDSRRSEGLRTVLRDAKSAVEARFENFEKAVRALLKDTNPNGGALCSAFEDLYCELAEGGFSKSRAELARCFQAVGLPGKKTASISLVAFKRLGRCQELVEAVKERWGDWAEAANDFASRYGEKGRFPLKDLFQLLALGENPDAYHSSLQELAATFSVLGLACEETSTISVVDFRHLAAIEEIYHAVVLRWGTFDKATGVLLAQKRIQGKLIPIEDLWHEIHKDNSFPHGTPELALALSALGIGCNEKSAITSAEFRKLAAWEDHLVADVDELQTKESTLHLMQVQRILMGSLNLGERLLARVSAALKEAKLEANGPGLDAAMLDLEDSVMILHEAVSSTNSATCLAEAVTSPYGLRLMVDVIQTASSDAGLQLVVVQLLSASISRVGGPAFVPPVMVAATSTTNTGRTGSNTVVAASNPRRSIDVLRAQALGGSPRTETTSLKSLQEFEQLFMAEVWLPLLKSFDPDDQEVNDPTSSLHQPSNGNTGSNNDSNNSNSNNNDGSSNARSTHGSNGSSGNGGSWMELSTELLQALLSLFLQVRMASVLVGSQGSRSAPDIEAELLRLHSSDLSPALLHQALSRFEFLEELDRMSGMKAIGLQPEGEADRQVSILAAGLCGRRLLREALERLQGSLAPALLNEAFEVLHKWDRERRKLASRYGMTSVATNNSALSNANGGQVDVLAKAALTVAREGYLVSWPDWGEVVEASGNSPTAARKGTEFPPSRPKKRGEGAPKSPARSLFAELDGVASRVARRLMNREEFISRRKHRPEEVRLSMSAKLAPIDHPMPFANGAARTKTSTTLTSPKLKTRAIGLPLQPLAVQKYGLATTCLVPSTRA